MKKRIVITGIGLVTPIGIGKRAFWEKALSGFSGISKLCSFDTSSFPTSLGAEIKNVDMAQFIKKHQIQNLDRTSQFGIAASMLALNDAKMIIDEQNKHKIAIIVGTTLGTISFILDQQMKLSGSSYKKVHNYLGHMSLHNCLSSDIAIETGISGSAETLSSACVSSISALDYAVKKIESDDYHACLVGGTESAFSQLPYAGLNIINALTNTSLKPFDENADGTVIGEGAAMFLIEELRHAQARKADIYCEIGGIESLCEAFNYLKRNRNGEVAIKTIDGAIKKSLADRSDVDLIIAHGMGILNFDRFEAYVLKKYFGSRLKNIPLTSIKPLVGHPLAAATAIQIAVGALSIKTEKIPHTLNTKKILDNSDINLVVEKFLTKRVDTVLINAYAFGGKCAASILKRYKD